MARTRAEQVLTAIYRAAWLVLAALALAMPVLSAIRLARIDGSANDAAASSILPFTQLSWLLYVINLLPALFLIAAASLLFWRRGRERVAILLSFSYLCSAAGMPFVEPWLAHGPLEPLRGVLEFAAVAPGLSGMMLFPDGRFVPRWFAVPALLVLPWTVARCIQPLPLPVDVAFNDGIGALVLVSVFLRYRRLPAGSPAQQQIRWAVFGMAIGLPLNHLAMLAFGRMSMPIGPETMGWMLIVARLLMAGFFIAMAGGMMISLLRYRLYDADAVISRSAAFAATTFLLAAVFAGTTEGIKWLIEHGLDQDAGMIPAAIAAGVATLLVAPAHERLRDWASQRFQKALRQMRRDLPLAVVDRRETASMPALLDEILERLEDGTRAVRAAVVLTGDGAAAVRHTDRNQVGAWLAAHPLAPDAARLDCDREDPLFPVRLPLHDDSADAAPLGWILLGPRPDGSFYGHDEREALTEVSDAIARAVRIVGLRDARAAEVAAHEARQEKRITALERQLKKLAKSAARPEPA